MSLEINSKVPDFSATCTGGAEFSLAAHAGKNLVIYFYPKDSTPGCTTEGENFRDLHAEFAQSDCLIFGVSRDSLKSHENFKAKLEMPFELISDPEEKVCAIFDVMKMKNMYGKQVRGVERSTFVINKKGLLVQAWRGVKVPGHAQAVLDFVRTIKD
ncbi:peroxiredoxin Q/BCP [Limnobacter thiooxidans]|uniref:thioredoxin-dependent peroxiredoxin n=1 Tax=Limnobacter thiooxidans TaxID=131080 RepID=A0AA86JJW9_9BURK|nr:peroxiredoxin Q/BCP [Limnobacter thiooxidans]BET25822.1 peroxiredoxin [Limnobacter thiooxidans]